MPDVRLIDANALEKTIIDEYYTQENPSGILTKRGEEIFNSAIDVARCRVREAPTIDAVPVVHGRWENEFGGYRNCSECGCEHPIRDARGFLVDDDYCPHCGTKMDGGADNG